MNGSAIDGMVSKITAWVHRTDIKIICPGVYHCDEIKVDSHCHWQLLFRNDATPSTPCVCITRDDEECRAVIRALELDGPYPDICSGRRGSELR
jgi:hypothetical protein